MALLVNLFGAPGAGKSTTRAGVFRRLKLAHVNCEEVPEVAKDWTWEERKQTLRYAPYLFGKQLRNLERVMDKVDVVVTDSPILLTSFYASHYGLPYPLEFHDLVGVMHEQMWPRHDWLIRRIKPFNPAGRNQTQEDSDLIGISLQPFLHSFHVKYGIVDGDEYADEVIAERVLMTLKEKKCA